MEAPNIEKAGFCIDMEWFLAIFTNDWALENELKLDQYNHIWISLQILSVKTFLCVPF